MNDTNLKNWQLRRAFRLMSDILFTKQTHLSVKLKMESHESFLNPFLFCIAWKILFVIWLSVTSLSFYFRLYHASTGMGFNAV